MLVRSLVAYDGAQLLKQVKGKMETMWLGGYAHFHLDNPLSSCTSFT